jgi:hypoxanthine phosphoribosyltransferase
MEKIHILDRDFSVSITNERIQESIKLVADKLNEDYKNRCPVFVCILNGAFMFAADLVRYLDFQPLITFARFSSYQGTQTTGEVNEVLGVKEDLEGKDVVIIEDIVDTGITMKKILPIFKEKGAASVEIACLLRKPGKLECDLDIKYCAMDIPDDFIVGYGLDYDGYGRNYGNIYTVVDDKDE